MRTPNNERLTPDIVKGRKVRTKSEPERRCILSGEHSARDTLIRLAVSPDGDVLPDPLAKAPGRGAWIGVSRAELETAMGAGKNGGALRGALARAFKGAPMRVPDDLPDQIDAALVRVLLDRLGLEMRAGNLILGSDRIAEHARGGVVALLLHAADAGEDGTSKLDQAWRVGREVEGSGERGIRLPLDRSALSMALGRDNVVHMALADPKAAARIAMALQRLMHFRGAESPMMGGGALPLPRAATTN